MFLMVTPSASIRTAGRTNADQATAIPKSTHAPNNGRGYSAQFRTNDRRRSRPVTPFMTASHTDERWRHTCRAVEVSVAIQNILALLPVGRDRSLRFITPHRLGSGRYTPAVSSTTAAVSARELLGVGAL